MICNWPSDASQWTTKFYSTIVECLFKGKIAKMDKVDQSENARDQRSEPNLKVWIQTKGKISY